MDYFLLAEIIGTVLYFFQKIFLIYQKRVGWLLGLVGSLMFTLVTLHKGSFAYTVLEATSGVVFLFGLFIWKNNERLYLITTLSMAVVAFLGIAVVFSLNLGSPNLLLENIMVVLFIIGACLLVIRNSMGWLCYMAGGLILIYYAYFIGTYYIMLLQFISMPFFIIGYKNFKGQSNIVN
jgi:nicotinamide riboside transporter PnuC